MEGITKIAEDTVAFTTTVEISRDELEQRLAFWTEELERIEETYVAQKAAAEKALSEVKAALKVIG